MYKGIFLLALILKLWAYADVPPVAIVETASGINNATDVDSESDKVSRIINGYTAKVGDAPWQVGLLRGNSGVLYCGGVLLSPRVVVTAAHCSELILPTDKVGMGNLDNRHFPLLIGIKQIFTHAKHNSPEYDNDIALLILDKEVTLTSNLRIANLPPTSLSYDRKIVLISGWGNTKSGYWLHPHASHPSHTLQAAVVKIYPKDSDSCKYLGHVTLTDNMICLGMDSNKGGCQGDSGGPAVLKGEDYLLGITSFGTESCKDAPSIYTKVSNYVSWINDKACEGGACLPGYPPQPPHHNSASFANDLGYTLMMLILSIIWIQ